MVYIRRNIINYDIADYISNFCDYETLKNFRCVSRMFEEVSRNKFIKLSRVDLRHIDEIKEDFKKEGHFFLDLYRLRYNKIIHIPINKTIKIKMKLKGVDSVFTFRQLHEMNVNVRCLRIFAKTHITYDKSRHLDFLYSFIFVRLKSIIDNYGLCDSDKIFFKDVVKKNIENLMHPGYDYVQNTLKRPKLIEKIKNYMNEHNYYYDDNYKDSYFHFKKISITYDNFNDYLN